MDLDEIIENVFMRATEFMHHSGLRMDADHVGKPQDLYLWCSVGGAKNWGLWGCPMRFTTGCPCAIRITETQHYLSLQFFGHHTPDCHARPQLTGRSSAPALGGHKSYYSPGKDSGKSCIFLSFTQSSRSPQRRADGDQDLVRRKASNVAFNIMHASVLGSPVMDMLRDDGSRRCDERRALLGYSSYDSDNDSDNESAQRWLGKSKSGKSGDGKYLRSDRQMR